MYFGKQAFTLVEILVVVAIISILTMIAFPQVTLYLNRSKDVAIKVSMVGLMKNASIYKMDMGAYEPIITSDCANLLASKSGLKSNPINFGYGGCGGIYVLQSLTGQDKFLHSIGDNSIRSSSDGSYIFRASKGFSGSEQHIALFVEMSDKSIYCMDDNGYDQKSIVATSVANMQGVGHPGLCQ